MAGEKTFRIRFGDRVTIASAQARHHVRLHGTTVPEVQVDILSDGSPAGTLAPQQKQITVDGRQIIAERRRGSRADEQGLAILSQ